MILTYFIFMVDCKLFLVHEATSEPALASSTVGEHPTHLEDMDELIEKAACANDKLKMLRLMYKEMYSNL